jgi:hypothetical protein
MNTPQTDAHLASKPETHEDTKAFMRSLELKLYEERYARIVGSNGINTPTIKAEGNMREFRIVAIVGNGNLQGTGATSGYGTGKATVIHSGMKGNCGTMKNNNLQVKTV